MNVYGQMASAVINNVRSGLVGYKHNPSMDRQQVEDEIIWTRQELVKKYILKNILPLKELMMVIRCIDIDCKDLERCRCNSDGCGKPIAHFVIPQVFTDLGNGAAIQYLGSTDMTTPFDWFTDYVTMKYAIYSRRGKKRPRVFIDTSPNEENLYDCYLFNAPLVKQVTIQALFKDPRQIFLYGCCEDTFETDDLRHNMSFMDRECMDIVTNKFIYYYKKFRENDMPNDQTINKP